MPERTCGTCKKWEHVTNDSGGMFGRCNYLPGPDDFTGSNDECYFKPSRWTPREEGDGE